MNKKSTKSVSSSALERQGLPGGKAAVSLPCVKEQTAGSQAGPGQELLFEIPVCEKLPSPMPAAKKHSSKTSSSAVIGKAASKPLKTRKKGAVKRQTGRQAPAYSPQYCERLLAFFDVSPFTVTEVIKKDGSVSLVETAAELPTFAAFARSLGVTQAGLLQWEEKHPDFAEAAKKARDLQGDILIQNSLRGNYSSSFAVFTAKNILGWSDGKNEPPAAAGPLVVRWEKE